ncbi:hypothetical protein EIL87_01115 [Saccharopolyspora rhizosphaerae]|uniref:Uncharacterized protein n=1 Tax=Saccharopolyspora rhizosphaerae TaxID=2492662 RepID=A0A426K551_9PSEU|nr:hypothetical protein [Saccharopolyspora rhizosphaerae]RRO20524.1 hypothetical protein EIL87_01115 [Saccharopolyspora rhizosphaerae]
MFHFKIEAAHEGVMHKGKQSSWDSRFTTACGKSLPKGTYKESRAWWLTDANCADCLSTR